MLILVTDWQPHDPTHISVRCPKCQTCIVVPLSAPDPDGCVYLDCCGGMSVRLSGWIASVDAPAVPT